MIYLNTYELFNEGKSNNEITAYHGSPYKFDKFHTSKMGSGHSMQMDGWGIYLTTDKDSATLYGSNLYQVSLFKSIKQYNLMDLSKPLKKDLFGFIIKSVYKYKKEVFDGKQFNLYYEYINKIKKVKNNLWNILKKIDHNLNMVTLSEVLDTNNKNAWFYITNYTKNNKKLQTIFKEFISLPKVNFNDYGFDLTSIGSLFYKRLSDILGGDKRASLFLLNIGIDGMTRRINKSRIDYIIFDENSINIEQILET